ncbi:MAG: iron-containing alcohol dehydrogenase [Dehalococcoidales bacterium]|nr:iron-containing alcohol dehydrogenase [Dehalococcoidales bacterium]
MLRNFSIRVPNTIFGNGVVNEVGKIAKDLGARKVMLITGRTIGKSETLNKVKKSLEEAGIGTAAFSEVEPDNPIENVIASARAAQTACCDMIIGVGGGSTMDNAKAASVLADFKDIDKVDIQQWLGTDKVPRRGLLKIMIPTTSGTGSEWTMPIIVMNQGRKAAMRSAYLVPDYAIVDPLLTLDMPQKVTAETGMDAMTHAIEEYTGWRPNLWGDMIAAEAIRLIGANLRAAYAKGAENVEARYNMSFASMIACNPVLSVGANLGHGTAHALQSVMHNLTHGEACSMMLCAVMSFNMISNLEKFATIAPLMGENVEGLSTREKAEAGIEAIRQLSIDVGIPQRLRDIGMKKEDIKKAVDILFEYQTGLVNQNPRHCTREDATKIFESVW